MADKAKKGKETKTKGTAATAVVGEPASNSHSQKKTHPSPSGNASSSKDTGVPPPKRYFSIQAPWGRKQRESPNYSKMPLEEKRKHYSCGDKFLVLKDLPTWAEFHEYVPYPKGLKGSEYSVDSALNKKVSLWKGDITRLEIDAIVNAANSSLLGGGGVDGAIHQAAGSSLRHECEGLRGCSTGDAKLTGGHRLPAKYILHTVGPMNRRKEKLQSCYDRCFELVLKNKIRSVAFPCIATGVYGYPHKEAAQLALGTVRRWLEGHREEVDRVIFCVFLKIDNTIYSDLMHYYFPVESPVDSSEEQKTREETDGSSQVTEKSETLPFQPTLKSSLSAPASTADYTDELVQEGPDQKPEHKPSSEQTGVESGAAEEITATEETPEQAGVTPSAAEKTPTMEERMEEDKGTELNQPSTSEPDGNKK